MSERYSAVRSDVGVWMSDDDKFGSVARMVAIDVIEQLGYPDDFRLRDRMIMAIKDRINGTLDFVASGWPRR